MAEIELLAHLPDPAKDKDLKDCPACHAAPNDPGRHKGPTTLYFAKNRYQTLCLACGHRTLPGKNQEEAMQNWERGHVQRLMKKLRLEKGLTRAELADLAGVTTDTIARLERNTSVGSEDTRQKIATALGISPNQL